jgi:hypothetical protein
MIPSRSFAVASLLAVLACSDSSRSSAPTEPGTPGPSAVVTVTGTVFDEDFPTHEHAVNLATQDGMFIQLLGDESDKVAEVSGAQASVTGTLSRTVTLIGVFPTLLVDRFQILSMRGRPALDGVLVDTADGVALRLADGTYRALTAVPADITQYLGARLWLTGSAESPPVEFGVIERP